MFSQPALVARLNGGDTQSQTFFTQQRVAAVTGTVRPDLAGFGEVGNIFLIQRSAGPDAVVGFTGGQRFADGVDAGDKFAVAQHIQHFGADAGHHMHVDHNVSGIGDLNTDFSDGRTDRTHAERDDIHGSAVHTTFVKTEHGGFEFFGIDPVVGRTGIFFFL